MLNTSEYLCLINKDDENPILGIWHEEEQLFTPGGRITGGGYTDARLFFGFKKDNIAFYAKLSDYQCPSRDPFSPDIEIGRFMEDAKKQNHKQLDCKE